MPLTNKQLAEAKILYSEDAFVMQLLSEHTELASAVRDALTQFSPDSSASELGLAAVALADATAAHAAAVRKSVAMLDRVKALVTS